MWKTTKLAGTKLIAKITQIACSKLLPTCLLQQKSCISINFANFWLTAAPCQTGCRCSSSGGWSAGCRTWPGCKSRPPRPTQGHNPLGLKIKMLQKMILIHTHRLAAPQPSGWCCWRRSCKPRWPPSPCCWTKRGHCQNYSSHNLWAQFLKYVSKAYEKTKYEIFWLILAETTSFSKKFSLDSPRLVALSSVEKMSVR